MASDGSTSSPQQWRVAEQYYAHRLKVVCFGQWVLHCERQRLREQENDQIAQDYRRFSGFAQALERFRRCSHRQQHVNALIGERYHELWRERWSLLRWTHTIRERRSFLRTHGHWNENTEKRERGTQFWLYLTDITRRASEHWEEKQRNKARICLHVLARRSRRKHILFKRKCVLFKEQTHTVFASLLSLQRRRKEERDQLTESTRTHLLQRRRRALIRWRSVCSRLQQLRELSALCQEHALERAQKMFFRKMRAHRENKLVRLEELQRVYRFSIALSMARVMRRLRESATERDFSRQRDRAFARKVLRSSLSKTLSLWRERVVVRMQLRSLFARSFFTKTNRQQEMNGVIAPEFLAFYLRNRERHLRAGLSAWKDFVFRVRQRGLFFAIYAAKKYRFLRCRRFLRLWRERVKSISRETHKDGSRNVCLSLSLFRRRNRLARCHFEKRRLHAALNCWIERVREWQQQWMGRQIKATLMYKLVRERNSFRLWRSRVSEKKLRRERLYAAKRDFSIRREKDTIKRLLFAALDDHDADSEGQHLFSRSSHQTFIHRRTLRKSFAAWCTLMNQRKHAQEQERREKILFFSSTSSSPSALLEKISSRLFKAPDASSHTVSDEYHPSQQREQAGTHQAALSTAVHARAPPRISSIHKMNGDFPLRLPSSEHDIKSSKRTDSHTYFAARAPPRRIASLDSSLPESKTTVYDTRATVAPINNILSSSMEPETPQKIKLSKEKLLLIKEVLGFIQECQRSIP